MASNSQTLLLLLLPFLLLLSFVGAHNITEILEPYSSYSTFNNYLTQTKLADEINRRQSVTILVVDNSKMSAISSHPIEILKHIMAIHVILDYYDTNKLGQIPHKSTLVTTLFQTSGIANNKLGFLNVTNVPNDIVVFGSATPEASLSSIFTKVVVTKPYNISVLQISDLIIPPGIESAKQASPPATPEKAPATIKKSPTGTHTEAPNTSHGHADAPQTSSNIPTYAPNADAPGASDVPTVHSSAKQTMVNGILGLVVSVIYLGAF